MIIRSQIIDFFSSTIQYTYAKSTVHNYIFDVYIDKHDRVWLIDFNVWAERTDSLLFSWEEIMKLADQSWCCERGELDNTDMDSDNVIQNANPEIRIVKSENQVFCDPLSSYRAPLDTIDLASNQIGSHSFQNFMAMCQPPSAMSDSDDD